MNSSILDIPRKSKNPFTKEEDEILKDIINGSTFISWKKVSSQLPGRNSKQCRERWLYYLSPGLELSKWTTEEEQLLLQLINNYGTKWSQFVTYFPNRSYMNIKNRYYSHIKPKIEYWDQINIQKEKKNKNDILLKQKIETIFGDENLLKINWLSNDFINPNL